MDAETLATLVGAENILLGEEAIQGGVSRWSVADAKRRLQDTVVGAPIRVLPADINEVAAILRWANETRTPVYPIGGLSNTVEAVAPATTGVALDLTRLSGIGDLDEESLLVTVEAGVRVTEVEDYLNERGYTLGQVPRSLKLLTVGGAVATNAIGAFSGRYGRFRDICAGLEVVLASGDTLQTSPTPGANAAFDLHDLFIGSEGTLGIVTAATLRVRPQPEVQAWMAFTFPTFSDGIDALRLIFRTDSRPTLARLMDSAAATSLVPGGRPLLLLSVEGEELAQTGMYQLAYAVCQTVGGTAQASFTGDNWHRRWQETDYLAANARPGGLADVFALAAPWTQLKALEVAARNAVAPLVTSLSIEIAHPTPHGAALELTVEAQAEPAAAEAALTLHRRITEALSSACQSQGGTMAHHYGIGRARRAQFAAERGPIVLAALRAIKAALDPNQILNPHAALSDPSTG